MNAIRTKLALACALVFALVVGGCGGEKGCGENPAGPGCPQSPSPPPPEVTTVLMEGGFPGLQPRFLYRIPFTTPATGSIAATVDWTFATDDVDAYIVRGSCTLEQFNDDTCPFVAFSESVSAKPERISAANQAAGSFNLYIANWGPEEESVSFQVLLTTGGAASSTSTTRVGKVGAAAEFVGIVSGH